jgi:UDPglucose 6-dehydrogenase
LNICVVGTGYVGLITGVCFADQGMNVTCADKNHDTISKLKNGETPIYEPGLETLIQKNCLSHRLRFTSSTADAVENASAVFLTVGTPALNDGAADLKYIMQAVDEIAVSIKNHVLIIIKSTVPVGSCRHIKRHLDDALQKANRNAAFDIVSNPEFLREGSAIHDFLYPDRIVTGTDNDKAAAQMKKLYELPIYNNTPFIYTTFETAEMIKYASNAFLASKISYINEIANICELSGADVGVVAHAMGLDKRIGDQFLHPGPGFGGSCFPKDITALIKTAKDLGYEPEIITSIMKSNLSQRKRAVQKIINATGDAKNKTFTVLGLAFKPGTTDIRESSSVYIIEELLRAGGIVKVYDPKAMDNMKQLFPEPVITYCSDELSACAGSDCIILATEWDQFRDIDFKALLGIVNQPVVIDLRNMYDPKYVKDSGFRYIGVGKQ